MGSDTEFEVSCFMPHFLKKINAFIFPNFDHFFRGHREIGAIFKLKKRFSDRIIKIRIIPEIKL